MEPVADCRGSPSRQALVPHLMLFSDHQGHDNHYDNDDDGADDDGFEDDIYIYFKDNSKLDYWSPHTGESKTGLDEHCQ